jgi:hypothetical protein
MTVLGKPASLEPRTTIPHLHLMQTRVVDATARLAGADSALEAADTATTSAVYAAAPFFALKRDGKK